MKLFETQYFSFNENNVNKTKCVRHEFLCVLQNVKHEFLIYI